MGARYAPKPVSADEVNTSFMLPPLSAVTPPLIAAAPMTGANAADAPRAVPMAGIKAGAKIATTGNTNGATALATFLMPFHRSLKKPYSGRPVAGFIVPIPPAACNMAASSGLMCANMVSPLRPCWAMPAICSGLTGPDSAAGAAATDCFVAESISPLTRPIAAMAVSS